MYRFNGTFHALTFILLILHYYVDLPCDFANEILILAHLLQQSLTGLYNILYPIHTRIGRRFIQLLNLDTIDCRLSNTMRQLISQNDASFVVKLILRSSQWPFTIGRLHISYHPFPPHSTVSTSKVKNREWRQKYKY